MISSKATPVHFRIADPNPLFRVVVASLRFELAVEEKSLDFIRVLVDEPAFAGADVDDVEIMPSCVAVVDADGNQIRVVVVKAHDIREHVSVGGQIARLGSVKADAPEVEVLVAVLVFAEQHMRIRARERVLEDRSVGLAGEWRGPLSHRHAVRPRRS